MIKFLKRLLGKKEEPDFYTEGFTAVETTDDIYNIPLGSVIELRDGEMAIIDDLGVDFSYNTRHTGIKLYHTAHMQYLITHITRNAIIHKPVNAGASFYWMTNKEKAAKELKKHFPTIIDKK